MSVDENDENLPLNELDKAKTANETDEPIVSAELVSEGPEVELSPDESPDIGGAPPFVGTLVTPTKPTKPYQPEQRQPFTTLCRLLQVLLILTTLASLTLFFLFWNYGSQEGITGFRFGRTALYIFGAAVATFTAIFMVKPQYVGKDVRSLVWGSLALTLICWLFTFPPGWAWGSLTWVAVHIPLAIVMNFAPKRESDKSQFDLHNTMAANGGAVAALALGIWSILGSFFSSLSIINSALGIALGLWGLTSRKKYIATTGILLCLLGVMACMFNLTYFVWDSAESRRLEATEFDLVQPVIAEDPFTRSP